MSKSSELTFAPEQDQPACYVGAHPKLLFRLRIRKSLSMGPFRERPLFSPLKKPLSESELGIITTAAPYDPDKGPQGQDAPYNAAAKFYQPYSQSVGGKSDLRIVHVGVERKNADMKDSKCWFPLETADRTVSAGRVKAISSNVYGLPTNWRQRHTLETDAHLVLEMLKADGMDVAVLIPNCPICHQSQSLLARYLESAGISTVLMGAAKDIVEYCGVPRFLFSDFPLGNAAAKPNDLASQDINLDLALRLLELAPICRTTRSISINLV